VGNLYTTTNLSGVKKYDSVGNLLPYVNEFASPNGIAIRSITVPEPSTYALAAIATCVMAAIARRRKARGV
jgi:hypothetical protein